MATGQDTKKVSVIIPDDTDRLYTIEEVAALLHASRKLVEALLKAGAIKCIYVTKKRRFIRKYTFNQFLEEAEGKDLYDLAGLPQPEERRREDAA